MEGLFERGSELDDLDAQIRDAAAGQGHLVVVEGPAGIGKSRLLAEARTRADGSVRALSARGSELEHEFAFGVLRQLFEAELATSERAVVALGAPDRSPSPADAVPGLCAPMPRVGVADDHLAGLRGIDAGEQAHGQPSARPRQVLEGELIEPHEAVAAGSDRVRIELLRQPVGHERLERPAGLERAP